MKSLIFVLFLLLSSVVTAQSNLRKSTIPGSQGVYLPDLGEPIGSSMTLEEATNTHPTTHPHLFTSASATHNLVTGEWTFDQKEDVGRWRWSKPNQPWHYASVEISKGRIGGSGTCISVDNPRTKKVEPSYVLTNYHVAGSSGRVQVTWLRPGKGRVTSNGTVVAGRYGGYDIALIKTKAPAWVRPISVACVKCGDIAYKGETVEVNSYGGRPRRGKDNLRHFTTTVKDYLGSIIELNHPLIGGDSGGTIISHDQYWPRLHGINARSDARNGNGPSDVLINAFLEDYFGVPRCTGKGECLPNKQNMFIFRRILGRLGRGGCDDDGCYPGDGGGGGDGGTHPDHPGDREPPDWWGDKPDPTPTEPTPVEPPVVITPPILPVVDPEQTKRIDELFIKITEIQLILEAFTTPSPSDGMQSDLDSRISLLEESSVIVETQIKLISAGQKATADALLALNAAIQQISTQTVDQGDVSVDVETIIREVSARLREELIVEVIPIP